MHAVLESLDPFHHTACIEHFSSREIKVLETGTTKELRNHYGGCCQTRFQTMMDFVEMSSTYSTFYVML